MMDQTSKIKEAKSHGAQQELQDCFVPLLTFLHLCPCWKNKKWHVIRKVIKMFFQETCKTFPNEKHDEAIEIFYAIV